MDHTTSKKQLWLLDGIDIQNVIIRSSHTLSFMPKVVYKYNPHFIIDIVLITRHATYGNETNIVQRPFLMAMSILIYE